MTTTEIQRFKFKGVDSRNYLSNIKVGVYVVSLEEYKSIGPRWVALYVNDNTTTYFDCFGNENVPEEMKTLIKNENIASFYRMQAYNSIICWYFCIWFIDFMFKDKSLTDFMNLFSPLNLKKKKNDKEILNFWKWIYPWVDQLFSITEPSINQAQ